MKNKLFVAKINTYYFGNRSYKLYILAEDYEEALKFLYENPSYKNDEDAELEEIYEIAEETKGVVNVS